MATRQRVISVMLGAMFLMSCISQSIAMTLVENGRAAAMIVLPEDPTPAETTAANELVHYLRAISGAVFEVVGERDAPRSGRIFVGQSEAARRIIGSAALDVLGTEEFIVRTRGRGDRTDLLLVGGHPRGTLYAVYSFLEDDLGVRWLTWYGDEFVPNRQTIKIETLDRRDTPAMLVRDIVVHTNSTSDREKMKRFLVRNRSQGPEFTFFGDMTAYGGASHSYVTPPHIIHTSFWFISPPGEYKGHGKTPDIFAKHPDYFSLHDGKRTPSQLCFSNPEVRRILTERILNRFEEVGGEGNISISAQDDHSGALCDCPDCRALIQREGTPGAPLFDYLAEAGPAVAREFPNAFLTTIAYRKRQTEIPPRTITFPDNVVIIFAAIDANFAASMKHPTNTDTMENLIRWGEITRNLWVWYYPNTSLSALPAGNLGRLAADFRLFKRAGVNGYFIQQSQKGVYDSRRLSDLQTWLITKLMWDPDQDLNALIRDFTDHYYGPAAPLIRQYIYNLEQATTNMTGSMRWNAAIGEHSFLTADFLVESQRLFARAEAAAADAPEFLQRVRYARMSLDLACLLLWEHRLHNIKDLPFTKQDIIKRYRETYAHAVDTRILSHRASSLMEAMESQLRPIETQHKIAPLPPPLDKIAENRIRQFTTESTRLHRWGILVEDPLAATGIAITQEPRMKQPAHAPAGLPPHAFNMGFYDVLTKRQQPAYAGHSDQPIMPGKYHLYSIGRTALNSACYVWFDWSWRVQWHDVSVLYDAENPGQEWDIYASIRFEGPAYDKESTEEVNRFYIDRVIFVRVEQ